MADLLVAAKGDLQGLYYLFIFGSTCECPLPTLACRRPGGLFGPGCSHPAARAGAVRGRSAGGVHDQDGEGAHLLVLPAQESGGLGDADLSGAG